MERSCRDICTLHDQIGSHLIALIFCCAVMPHQDDIARTNTTYAFVPGRFGCQASVSGMVDSEYCKVRTCALRATESLTWLSDLTSITYSDSNHQYNMESRKWPTQEVCEEGSRHWCKIYSASAYDGRDIFDNAKWASQ